MSGFDSELSISAAKKRCGYRFKLTAGIITAKNIMSKLASAFSMPAFAPVVA